MVLLVDTHIVHQEPLDDYQNEKLNPKENQTSEENNNFGPETTPEWSPDTTGSPDNTKGEQGNICAKAPKILICTAQSSINKNENNENIFILFSVIDEDAKEEPPKEQPKKSSNGFEHLPEVVKKAETDLKEKKPEISKTDAVVEKKKSSPKASPVKKVTLKEPTNDTSKDAVQKTENDGECYIFLLRFCINS